jgi:gamma-glutamyltranspeptidase/glutathione hydrolase
MLIRRLQVAFVKKRDKRNVIRDQPVPRRRIHHESPADTIMTHFKLTRRDFVHGIAGSCVGAVLPVSAIAQRSGRGDHYATGTEAGVTTTSLQASEAAIWAFEQGGNAADAYITAALTQTVSEPGLTSIGGAFGMHYFDAASEETSVIAGLLGPAVAEPYDFERDSPATQTGRAMPVPGFIAGAFEAHRRHGRLDWVKLFQPAIGHAIEGCLVIPELIAAAERKGAKEAAAKAMWSRTGRFLTADEPLIQAQLGHVLSAVAQDGPEAFYTGEFARHYVERAQADGGRITLDDLRRWKTLVRSRELTVRGNYRGYQVASAPLLVYAMHLNEALDLRGTGNAATSPDSAFKQLRIMEEVFLSTRTLSKENESDFVDPAYARQRADVVLNSPRREFNLDAIFNTCFLVVRDREGNCAWGTHSINSPSPFGAGIMVDGVYASYAINRGHVHGDGATAPGITTCYALFKDGTPRLIVGSPGYGFVHGPYQYGTGIMEWNLSPAEAMNSPRFSMPNAKGEIDCERHYGKMVLAMFNEKKFSHRVTGPTSATGLVGAFYSDNVAKLHFVQDGRRSGFARAK